MTSNWILHQNLRPFLESIAFECGYRLDDLDWDAIVYGISKSERMSDVWFEYEFVGDRHVFMRFAYEHEDDSLSFELTAAPEIEARIDAIVGLLQYYVLCRPGDERVHP